MNCFLIASPFQLLSAMEATNSRFFKSNKNLYLIFYGPNKNNNKVLSDFVSKNEIKGEIITFTYKNQFQFLISKLKVLKRIKQIQFSNLFVGHFDEFSNGVFMCNLSYSKLYNLDDGAFSLVLNERLNTPYYEINLNNIKSFNSFVKTTLLFLYGMKKVKSIALNWFTMFDFTPNNSQEIIEHNFEYLRKNSPQISNKDNDEICYFIGSNLLNVGVFKAEGEYLQFLENILSKLTSSRIIYIPHRYENINIISSILLKYNIEIEYPENIIELYFLMNGIYPSKVFSFYSTALYSISKIFQLSEIYYIRIPEDLLSNKFIHSVSTVQQKYSEKFKTFNYVK